MIPHLRDWHSVGSRSPHIPCSTGDTLHPGDTSLLPLHSITSVALQRDCTHAHSTQMCLLLIFLFFFVPFLLLLWWWHDWGRGGGNCVEPPFSTWRELVDFKVCLLFVVDAKGGTASVAVTQMCLLSSAPFFVSLIVSYQNAKQKTVAWFVYRTRRQKLPSSFLLYIILECAF